MSEHITNYLGNQNFITQVSGSTHSAVIGQNFPLVVSGTDAAGMVVEVPSTLYLEGRQLSITDWNGAAAGENIIVSGTDINGSTTYTMDADYEGVTLISSGSDAWVAVNTQT